MSDPLLGAQGDTFADLRQVGGHLKMGCSGFQILQEEGSTVNFIGVVIIVSPGEASPKAG